KRGRYDWSFLDAYQILAVLWEAQITGDQLNAFQIRKQGVKIPHLLITQVLEILNTENWVYRTGSGKWMLARDINELTLLDLHRILPRKLPERIKDDSNPWQHAVKTVIDTHQGNIEECMSVKLGTLFRQSSSNK
ncbi:MAG TPA: hypothetical protein VIV20_06315, partial [Gammaproteobacteria bacterium]